MNTARERVKAAGVGEVIVADWFECWASFFPKERNAKTAKHDGYMLRRFARKHGRKRMGEVTPLLAQEWALKYPGEVRYLRQVWEKAFVMRLVELNVWRLVRAKKHPQARRQTRPPSLHELDTALEVARAKGGWWLEFADLVEFAAFTGARAGGICDLRIGQVDELAKRAVLSEKGDKKRTVVLTVRALQAVGRQKTRRGWLPTLRLFRSKGRKPITVKILGEGWREIRGEFPGSFHTLRHFASTWLAEAGVDPRDIAVQLGHFDREGRPYVDLIHRVYVHPDHGEALARIERQTA